MRTSETWGKPQTLKKFFIQVLGVVSNFRSKNISEMDRRLPFLDFVCWVDVNYAVLDVLIADNDDLVFLPQLQAPSGRLLALSPHNNILIHIEKSWK